MELKDIAQIILIPILTVLLSYFLDKYKEKANRNLIKDQEVFESLKSSFTEGRDLVVFFRDHSVGDLTHRGYITQLCALKEKLQSSGFIFVDRKLEKYRKQLSDEISKFIEYTSVNFFTHEDQHDYYELKFRRRAQQGDIEAEERFTSLYKEIDDVGTTIYRTYDNLVTLAQKKL
jgi:hypothetical protein